MLPQGNLDAIFNLAPLVDQNKVIQGELVVIDQTNATSLPESIKKNELTEVASKLSKKIEDSDYIRSTAKDLIEQTQEALEVALMNATNDPDPKAVSAFASVISSLNQSLKILIDLGKVESDKEIKLKEIQIKETEGQDSNNGNVVNTQNNTIILTTDEMISKILQRKAN